MQVRPPLLLRIDHQVDDIFQVCREVGEKLLNIAQAQLFRHQVLRPFNRIPISRLHAMYLYDLIHVMHEIG